MRFLNTARCILCVLPCALLPQMVVAQVKDDCPLPQQPMLSNTLSQMINARQGDTAMQCIIKIADRESDSSDEYPDEVRYQLAKQASDALESLEAEGINAYQVRAAKLWESYLSRISEPLDRTRLPFGITKIMQHARSGAFEDYLPVIAQAMNRARAWITPAQADQLFATLKRCPQWSSAKPALAMPCINPCGAIGKTFITTLSSEFGATPWAGSNGVKRLAVNARAVEGELTCSQ